MDKEAYLSYPKVSVIVAVYNGAETLQRCIDSVANQTYSSIELIIMDGGSTDGTVDIIKENQDVIAYWELKPDRGISHAWNKGVDKATGEWIYFLGADDYLYDENVMENFVSKVDAYDAGSLILYGSIMHCDGEKRIIIGQEWDNLSLRLRDGMCIPHQGAFHHKELFKLCGIFDEHYKIAGDYDLVMRSLVFDTPKFMPDFVVANMSAGGLSNCRYKRWEVLCEFREIQKKMGVPLTVFFVYQQLKAQFFRFFKVR